MLDFDLTEEQLELKKTAARLASDVYAPRATEWDESRSYLPDEERRRLADLGFLGIGLPVEYGGGGGSLVDILIIVEEIAKECQLAAFPIFEAGTGPARVVDLFGTDDQKARLLPPIIAGEKTMALAISEPGAGSAATDMELQGRVEGDDLIITGTKRWCSGAGHAEQYLAYFRTPGVRGSTGIGAAVVGMDASGLTFGSQERLMGFRGIGSCDLFFDGVRVPLDDVIVEPGGFRDLFTAFSIERLGNATMSLAIGQSCLDRTANYVQERRQFGKELIEFQTVQAALAEMVMQVDAARLLIYRAASGAGRGAPNSGQASIAKCFANAMAKRGLRHGDTAAWRIWILHRVRDRTKASRRSRLGNRRWHADDAACAYRVRVPQPTFRPASLNGPPQQQSESRSRGFAADTCRTHHRSGRACTYRPARLGSMRRAFRIHHHINDGSRIRRLRRHRGCRHCYDTSKTSHRRGLLGAASPRHCARSSYPRPAVWWKV